MIIQKGMMLIKKNYQKSVIFVTIAILTILVFNYEPYLCNGCHDLIQKGMSFNNIAIIYVKGNTYRIQFWCMSKDDAINITNGLTWLIKGVFYKKKFIIYKK